MRAHACSASPIASFRKPYGTCEGKSIISARARNRVIAECSSSFLRKSGGKPSASRATKPRDLRGGRGREEGGERERESPIPRVAVTGHSRARDVVVLASGTSDTFLERKFYAFRKKD